MVEEIPLAFVLGDGVVSGPANDRSEDHALIGERSVRIVTNGIAEEVAVACRVGEVVLTVVLVHPRSFEETVWVAGFQRLSVLVENQYWTWSLSKLQDVVTHLHHETGKCGGIGQSKEFALSGRFRTHIDESVFVTMLAMNGCKTWCLWLPPL